MIEKEMVNDALNNINSALTSYASAIAQTENTELRSTLIQMRNQAEKSQYDLYNIAKNLNYYHPAQQASQEEISKVKSEVSGSCQSCGNCCSCNQESSMNAAQNMNNMSNSSSSGQEQGLVDDLDEQKRRALQAPPKSMNNTFS